MAAGVNNPVPAGFDALPVLDLHNPNFTVEGNRLLAELRAKVRFAGRLHAQREFRVRFRAVLERGSACGCAKTAGTCRELLRREVSLFLFAFVAGVGNEANDVGRAPVPLALEEAKSLMIGD